MVIRRVKLPGAAVDWWPTVDQLFQRTTCLPVNMETSPSILLVLPLRVQPAVSDLLTTCPWFRTHAGRYRTLRLRWPIQRDLLVLMLILIRISSTDLHQAIDRRLLSVAGRGRCNYGTTIAL
jgi:hypothetical protein